jgi:hypothetical protein
MGVLDWFRGKTSDTTAQFIREKLAEHVAARDATAIANVASALDGASTMALTTTSFSGRDHVRNEVFDALRALLPDLPHEKRVTVFAQAVLGGALPVDVTGRREIYDDARRAIAADIAAHVRASIDTASADQLAATCVRLRARGQRTVVRGIEIPRFDSLREQLELRALERLRTLVPTLEGDAGRRLLLMIRSNNLNIHVGTRLAELEEQHRAHVQTALAAISDEPRNAELEAALDSDDPAAFAVLADWLAERDHPRGALIALQLRAEIDRTLDQDVATHIDDHAIALLGELAGSRTTHVWHGEPAFTWKRGFIDAALLTMDEDVSQSPYSLAELLQLLLAHGSARRLRELRIGVNEVTDAGLAELVEILGARRPTLRRLVLGDFTPEQSEISWFSVGSIAPVWQLPELRELAVRGADIELGAIEHAKLERLELETGGLPQQAARELAAAKLPSLRHLDVAYGDPDYGGSAELDDVRALLERSDFPVLVHLGLKNTTMSDAICTLLPRSPLAAQLVELDLSLGTLTSAGARTLVANKRAFASVVSIDVSKTYIDDAAVAQLRAAFPTVIANELRRDEGPGQRYVSAGE